MAAGYLPSAHDSERVGALVAGLAATIAIFTLATAFAPSTLDALGNYSPWLYGPAATAVWALFSAVAYLLIRRDRWRKDARSAEIYRCRELPPLAPPSGCSVCANQKEKNRLAAVTAGFGLTMSIWVMVLSFMPGGWLDWLGQAPAWLYCIASVTVWAIFSNAMYLIFRSRATLVRNQAHED
jgi:hypothetical protein